MPEPVLLKPTLRSRAARPTPPARPVPGGEDLLAAVPVVNRAVTREPRGGGVIAWVPRHARWWNTGWVGAALQQRRRKGVQLDRLGSEVLALVDGERDVEAVVEAFAQRHRLGFHEARLAVLQFLNMLTARNVVALVWHDDGEAGGER